MMTIGMVYVFKGQAENEKKYRISPKKKIRNIYILE